MKKILLALALLACSTFLIAQQKTGGKGSVNAGLGPEFNMDSRHNFAGGAAFSFDYGLTNDYALGFTVTGSSNFINFNTIEPLILFRRYMQDKEGSRLFLQLDAGVFIIFEDGDVIPMADAGLRGGVRIPFGPHFYLEPYGRLGYPFAFGIGAMAGIGF